MKKLLILLAILFTPNFWPARAATVGHVLNSLMVAKAQAPEGGLSLKQIKEHPYTIQVASYLSENDAISHVEELRLKHVKNAR